MDNPRCIGGTSAPPDVIHVPLKERLRIADESRRTGKTFPISGGPGGSGSPEDTRAPMSIGRYQIIVSQFCVLSREAKLHQWLQNTVVSLHDDLVRFVASSQSCRANSDKMHKVLNELVVRGEGQRLLDFLKTEYPNVIREIL